MNAKDVLILHGEKAVVGLIGAACLWSMYSTLTNDEIRAAGGDKGMSAEEIKQSIADIDLHRQKAEPPMLKQVPNYAGRLSVDLGTPVVAQPAMAWTTAHPDLGSTVVSDYFYVYEALPVRIEAVDKVGAVSLTLHEPGSTRTLERMADGGLAQWSRRATVEIKNHAEIIGVQLERKDGETWGPVGTGFIPYERLSESISLTDVEDYGTYSFRARPIIAATGYTYGNGDGGSVLVHAGPAFAATGTDADVETFIAKCIKAIGGDDPELFAKLLPPAKLAAPGVELRPGETLHAGPWSEVATVEVSSPIRFQLDKLSPNVNEDSATVLATRLMRNAEGKEGWVEMQKFTLKKGEMLGGQVQAPDPLTSEDFKVNIDLRTPFKLVKVERGVQRLIYWELKLVTGPDGKSKVLDLSSKSTQTDTATFLNTRNGKERTLVKLGRITVPVGRILEPPGIQSGLEDTWFKENPATFVQQPREVAPPIRHEPGTGPLAELKAAGDNLAHTETPYYELSNGRLWYYEPINKVLMDRWKPGVTPVADPVVEPKPGPEPVEPTTRRRPGDEAPADAQPEMLPEDMPPPEDVGPIDEVAPPLEAPPAPRGRRAR